jgi:predicted nucleotidyltransferase
MRLSPHIVTEIKTCFHHVFGEGQIILFGSRVDNSLKGGDIDLYLLPEERTDLLHKKLRFLVMLKKHIGDRKIDVLIVSENKKSIEIEAMKTGVTL